MQYIFLISLLLLPLACVHDDEGLTEFKGEKPFQENSSIKELEPVVRDSEIVLESQGNVSEQLLVQKVRNSKVIGELKSSFFALEDCQNYLMDPRLGGASEPVDLPKFQLLVSQNERYQETYLDDDGKLQVKSTQKFAKALAFEKEKEKILQERKDVVQKVLKRCQAKLAAARISKGLPAEKYSAILKKTRSGKVIIIRKAEMNLDDAFEIKEMIEAQKEEEFVP